VSARSRAARARRIASRWIALAFAGCGLLARRKVEPQPGFVECPLLLVAPHLGVVEAPLADVAIALLAIDPSLAVVKDAVLADGSARGVAALVVVAELLLIDARLIAVAHELLAVADRLLQLAQALFLGELSRARRRVMVARHMRLLVVGRGRPRAPRAGTGRPIQKPCA